MNLHTDNNIFGTISFIILLATMLWLPIPKAGMMAGAFPVLMIFIWAVAGFSVLWLLQSESISPNLGTWIMPWLLFTLCVAIHLFVVPFVFGLSLYFPTDTVLSETLTSIKRPVHALHALQVWGFFSVMWVCAWRTSLLTLEQAEKLVLVIFVASAFQIIYGLWHFLSGGNVVLGLWDKVHYTKDATGTFVNRNHYSGFLALCWPIILSGLLANRPLLFTKSKCSVRTIIAIFYSLLIAVALVSSHSRMGTAAAFFGLMIWGVIYFRNRAKTKDTQIKYIPHAVVALVIVFALWFGIEDIASRYMKLEGGDSRFDIWAATFDLPIKAWLVGIGPGAFEDVFHLVQPPSLNVRFTYVHNDYLEFLLEFGIIGSLLIVCLFILWVKRVIPSLPLSLRAGAFVSICVIGLHSIVDFNLQIPASALYFWIAVGLLCNPVLASHYDETQEEGKGKIGRRRRRKRR